MATGGTHVLSAPLAGLVEGTYVDAWPACILGSPAALSPSRYGAKNENRAASVASGACSANQWPAPGMTALCTSFARGFSASPTASPQLSAPLMASTGIGSGWFLRCSFCAIMASHSR
jgi:hypothetical protein